MFKEFKYTKRSNADIRSAQIDIITRIHSLAASRGLVKQPVYAYKFPNPDDDLLYDVLCIKLQRYTSALKYREDFQTYFHNRFDSTPEERYKHQWKHFWGSKRTNLRGRFGAKWDQSKTSFYKNKKSFWKNIYFRKPFEKYNRYGYLDYRYMYDTSGYKWRKYTVDNNNNFISYFDE